MRHICTSIVATLVLAGTSLAATINVPADYTTIQAAVDAASNGDEIIVAPGTYTGTGAQAIPVVNMLGKTITLRASGTAKETIINGELARQTILCTSGETPATVIEGLTITGGHGNHGAGVYIANESHPTLTGCIIRGCSANRGGGIACESNSNPTLMDCTIGPNSASYNGGGISCDDSSPTITGCTIVSNHAASWGGFGGGIHCRNNSSPTITGCTISDNLADDNGGGIYCDSGDPTLSDTVVCGNSPNQIGGTWTDGGNNTIQETCPSPSGACCTGNEVVCVPDASESDCLFWGGYWLGIGSSCDDCDPPAPRGACCVNGICVEVSEAECWDVQGSYAGDDITCEDAGCPSSCLGDIDGDGVVAVDDVLTVIANWGPCP